MSTPQEMPLPVGATAVKPRTVEIAGWVPMEIDAELWFAGIKWLRVKGGFGGCDRPGELHHPREDWIADLPGVSLHVGRYLSTPDDWKHDGATMEEALRRVIKRRLVGARNKFAETERELGDLSVAIKALAAAVGRDE